jgi:DNA-binding IscR family transcriptional regulator
MLLIGRNFYRDFDPKNVTDLAADMQIPAGLVKEFLEMFAENRLVLPMVDGETYVLGRDPETIGVKEILDCVRNSGKKMKIPNDRSAEEREVNALLRDVDDSMSQALTGKSLQAAILSLSPPSAAK